MNFLAKLKEISFLFQRILRGREVNMGCLGGGREYYFYVYFVYFLTNNFRDIYGFFKKISLNFRTFHNFKYVRGTEEG